MVARQAVVQSKPSSNKIVSSFKRSAKTANLVSETETKPNTKIGKIMKGW